VAPRQREPYIVRAGDVVVRVVGTQFRVARFEERVTVAVERGIVDVQFRGEVHRLTAGQSWSSQEQTASTTVPAPTQTPPSTIDEPVPPPTNTKPAKTIDRPAVGSNGKPVAIDEPKKIADQAAKAKYYEMTALERRDPKRASEGYLELSKGNSEWSANALFALGRLAHDRKDPKAKTFLEIYLKRFPKGGNAEDARDLLSRLGDKP
jgi:hypothetical protein